MVDLRGGVHLRGYSVLDRWNGYTTGNHRLCLTTLEGVYYGSESVLLVAVIS